MLRIDLGAYTLAWAMGRESYGDLRRDAIAMEEIGSLTAGDEVGVLAVYKRSLLQPILVVAVVHTPWYDGHQVNLGAVLVPETEILFVGAVDQVLAYDLRGPSRLWREEADFGFGSWQRHGEYVVLAAELELAAWDMRGAKQWQTFVEPPYDYTVENGTVHLTVMNVPSTFPLASGPAWGNSLPWQSQ